MRNFIRILMEIESFLIIIFGNIIIIVTLLLLVLEQGDLSNVYLVPLLSPLLSCSFHYGIIIFFTFFSSGVLFLKDIMNGIVVLISFSTN